MIAIIIAILVAIYIVGAVICYCWTRSKDLSLKWPLFLMIYPLLVVLSKGFRR